MNNQIALLRQLHRDADIGKVQDEIDAIQGIKAQSIEPRVRWEGLMGLLNHTFATDQRIALLQQALPEAEKIGPGTELVQTLEQLASAYSVAQQMDLAELHIRRAISVGEQVFGHESPKIANDLNTLSSILGIEKKEDEAEATRRRQVAILEKTPGHEGELLSAQQGLADLYNDARKYEQAEPLYLASLRGADALYAPGDWTIGNILERVAAFYRNWGKYEEAAKYHARAVELDEKYPRPGPLIMLADLENLSNVLRKLNRADEAQRYDQRRKQLIDEQISKGATPSPTK